MLTIEKTIPSLSLVLSKNLSTTDFRARNSGTCGDNLTWTLSGSDDDLTLTITGTGEMKWTLGGSEGEYGAAYESVPWVVSQRNIRHLSLPEGLTRIKAYAFANCPLEEIEIPSTVQYIDNQAFRFTSCGDKARSLILNGTVDRLYIMDNAFCDAGIKDIYFKEDSYYTFSAVDAVRETSIFWSGSEAPADYTDYWGNLHTFKVSNGYCYHTVTSHSHS
ncbi:MAG: leucine-rich repeat protein, partial [Lachnospiraceae bacterium]|nr:leucine-rich repeat protein [Lachnospiraceae bacterium]